MTIYRPTQSVINKQSKPLALLLQALCILVLISCENTVTSDACIDESLCIDSLDNLSIEALRSRTYDTTILVAQQLGSPNQPTSYSDYFSSDGTAPYPSYMISYDSDGLNNYARIDIPVSSAPEAGFPVLVFAHGWVGIEGAPYYNFGYEPESFYGELVDTYVDAGYLVITPGYRGHGTIDNRPAGGIEYMQAWDNGSYLMPTFYAIDLLNLIEGLDQISALDWKDPLQNQVQLNLGSINLLAHSQGGDVALTALAISGKGSSIKHPFSAASIWSGNIPDRFTQANTFGAMASSLQAFMSGDGSWTGSALGQDGSLNPDFIFAWPADWIGTLDTSSEDWTWQIEQWDSASVEAATAGKYQEMYNTLNSLVRDTDSAAFEIGRTETGKLQITHSQEIVKAMNAIGGFGAERYLSEPLALHFSDRDYYSFPAWNKGLSERVNNIGGQSYSFEYPGNTHSLKRSSHLWFSPTGTEDGYKQAIQRDLLLFSGQDPNLEATKSILP